MEQPNAEQVNNFRIAEVIEAESKDLNQDTQETEREDLEDDMQLKAMLLDPQAKKLFSFLNKPDLLLSYVDPKDKKLIESIRYDITLACDLFKLGFPSPAELLATRILSQLNFNRSLGGFQQQTLITRAKQTQIQLSKENSGLGSITKKMKR